MPTNQRRSGSNPGGAFDPDKDAVLGTFKVKREDDGYTITIRSYDGHEPRVHLERHYRDRDGQWRKDAKKIYPRLPFFLVTALLANSSTLDKAWAEWEGRGKSSSSPEKDEEGTPF